MQAIKATMKPELLDGEEIIYHTKMHWIIFKSCIGWYLISLAIFVIGNVLGLGWLQFRDFPPLYVAIGIITLLLAMLYTAHTLVLYYSTDYAITNRRVIRKTGFFTQTKLGILLERIEVLEVVRPLLGRILNYGGIIIVGVGGTQEPLPYIPDPANFRKKIQIQIQEAVKRV